MASPEPARPAPLLGPSVASSALVGTSCLAALFDAWASWHRHGVAVDYDAGEPGVGVADLTSASATGRTVDTVYVVAMFAAALAVLVWLARVRVNERLRGRAGRPTARLLVFGVWLALCLFAVVTTALSETDLATLARIDTAGAGGLCVAGTVLVVVIRRTTRRDSVETNQRGQAMRG